MKNVCDNPLTPAISRPHNLLPPSSQAYTPRREIRFEAVELKPRAQGVGNQIRPGQVVLVFEEQLMHRPEFLLSRCRFGGLGGDAGVLVNRGSAGSAGR